MSGCLSSFSSSSFFDDRGRHRADAGRARPSLPHWHGASHCRGWVEPPNFVGIALSTVIFLVGAAVTAYWVPDAFTYSLIGLGVGCALGIAGLALSRWEPGPRSLIYTPNRWLVLAITMMVTARILFGFWRGWETWRAGFEGTSLLVSAGVAKSLAAGAVVLGY